MSELNKYGIDEQVFVSEEINASELYKTTILNTPSVGEKRKFTAYNNVYYVWDEEENCWVIDEDEDEDEAGEGEGDGEEVNNDGDQDIEMSEEKIEDEKNNENSKPKSKKKKSKRKGQNNWIYITGLPYNVTIEEVKAHFAKAGIIAISPIDQSLKIKLYRDEEGNCKGDGSLCYHAPESVEMAVSYFDGGYIRPTHKITVTRAEFQVKSDSNQSNNQNEKISSKKPSNQSNRNRPKVTHAQVKVVKSALNQALSWNEDDDSGVSKSHALKIVVLEGMFKPSDFDDPSFADELEQDIASECEKCGQIEKITVFSKNIRGIAIVKFTTSFAAQKCIDLMDGRYFARRKLRAYFWDGVTDYTVINPSVVECEEAEEKARLNEFGDWLEKEQETLPDEFQPRTK
jgi:HIV Tat-specific factor 1